MKKLIITALIAVLLLGAMPVQSALATGGECNPETRSPGYWKTHDFWVEVLREEGSYQDLLVGKVTSLDQVIEMMDSPVRNDKGITMYKAYVAAWLNRKFLNSCSCDNYQTMWQAQIWLRIHWGDSIKANSDAWQTSVHGLPSGESMYLTLDYFNNYGCN